MHKQVWKMGEVAALSEGRPSEGRSGRVTRWGCLLKGTPSGEHPPGDTRWEARWGGTISTPTSNKLRDGRPISTSWLLTKMPIRHLSYISTDLFRTKISTANTKVAFSPLDQGSFVWERPFYIQSHKFFPTQKICGSVTKKFFVQNSKSAVHQLAQKATNWQNPRMVRERLQVRNPPTARNSLGGCSAWRPTAAGGRETPPQKKGAPDHVVFG